MMIFFFKIKNKTKPTPIEKRKGRKTLSSFLRTQVIILASILCYTLAAKTTIFFFQKHGGGVFCFLSCFVLLLLNFPHLLPRWGWGGDGRSFVLFSFLFLSTFFYEIRTHTFSERVDPGGGGQRKGRGDRDFFLCY